ncbi:MAG: sulfatase-like hydrolase/transferase, partial [Planctomycetes bacterium]|nr:sulfatase-like hydrolase/transferase [Planctomycetota bacterium]
TPIIDSLAERGVLYENCVSQSSWTRTSITALLYSAWPVIKGERHCSDYVPDKSRALKAASPGVTRLAFQANPHLRSKIHTRVFDHYSFLKRKFYAPADEMNGQFDWEVPGLLHEKKRFVAYIHYMDSHEPYTFKHRFRGKLAPENWKYSHPSAVNHTLIPFHDDTGKFVKELPIAERAWFSGMAAAYDEDVMYLDLFLGNLLDMLSHYGIADETTLILTADHGQAFGEHGWCGHKMSLYQEEIHVPLVIAGPGIPKGRRVKAQVRSIDIVPTIAALAGTSVLSLAGAPLLPADRVEAGGNRPAYSCCDYAKYGEDQRLITCLVSPERMKYIRTLTKDHKLLKEELFDLNADGLEKSDLILSHSEAARRIARQMDDLEASNFWRKNNRTEEKPTDENKEQLHSLGYL